MKTSAKEIPERFVIYCRVSTQRQGRSGLGLEAQRTEVMRYVSGSYKRGTLIAEFIEHESGRKSDKQRPQLRAALDACKRHKAVLLVARLDRLARNVAFLSALLEADVQVIFCDMPGADRFQVHIMAAVAEYVARRISADTRAALAAAKARGTVLGNPQNLSRWLPVRIATADRFAETLRPLLTDLASAGRTQREMCERLNQLNVAPPQAKPGAKWSLVQVQRVQARLRARDAKGERSTGGKPSHAATVSTLPGPRATP